MEDRPEREEDLLEALKETAGSALAIYIPFIGPALAGFNAYKQSVFNRNVKKMLGFLMDKLKAIDNIRNLFSDDWLKTAEGKQFTDKVIDLALDAQYEEKQELFINALINGIRNEDVSNLEKFKFIELLRGLSIAALYILSDMYEMIKKPSHEHIAISSTGLIIKEDLVKELSVKYPPYLIEAAYYEMQGAGLFSPTVNYVKLPNGRFHQSGYHAEGNNLFTEFTRRFVEFVLYKKA